MFDWIVGGATAAVGAVVAWVLSHLIGIDKRLTVLEARPVVDPIQYTAAVTQMAAAITELTKAIADMRMELKEFRHELDQAIKFFREGEAA